MKAISPSNEFSKIPHKKSKSVMNNKAENNSIISPLIQNINNFQIKESDSENDEVKARRKIWLKQGKKSFLS